LTIARGLLRHARRVPGATALVVGGERHTYGDLATATLATAKSLRAAIDRPGARVGVLARPGAEFFQAFLGAGLAGMAAVVLQAGWSDRELRAALEAARPALVVGPPGSATLPPGGTSASRLPPVSPEQPFYVGFTSGSTGRPRGFVRSHRSWLRSVEISAPVLGIRAGEHVLVPGPLDHSLFLYAAVHGLSLGATVHLQLRFAPHTALRALARLPASRLVVVPAMLAGLVHAAGATGARPLPGVRSVICSGAALHPTQLERAAALFPNAEFVDFYGASELSFVSARYPSAADPPDLIGRPFPGVEVSVRDARGSALPTGTLGRLWVRSDMLFDSYLEPPDAAGAVRDAGGWVTVGDLARLDAGGNLYLAGREATMLNCGGLNVYPEEIELVLLELPEVLEAAVVGLDDPDRGQVPCALVRLHAGREEGARRRLREHCHARLARGKRPRRWLLVSELPRTAGGKIARESLARALRDGALEAEELP
jgi:long-chain acyl-CoA synthetase